MRPHSGTAPYMEQIITQPPHTGIAQWSFKPSAWKYTGQRQLHIMPSIALAYILYVVTLINTSSTRENEESVLFHPVLKAYPTCHSQLITACISLGNLEWHWKSFTRQMDRTQQLLQSLSNWPSAPTHLLSALQAELTNLNDIYTSHKPIIITAINLLNTEPSFSGTSNYNKCTRKSLLPFLGDALSWLIGTATTKDITSIKKRVNQLITAQTSQQETIVHIVSILNVTRYANQVNRQHISVVMDAVDKTVEDVNNLYNITTSMYTSLSYHQLVLHIRSVLANLWVHYPISEWSPCIPWITLMQATTGTLSPHILPIKDLKQMLSHIEGDAISSHAFTSVIWGYPFIDTYVPMFW